MKLAALLSGVVAVSACSTSSADATLTPSYEGADAGKSSGGPTVDGALAPLDGVAPEVILVHASPDLPAMRLCLSGGGDEPIPVDNIMPRTNQVGVDVGGAAYVGNLLGKTQPLQKAYLFRANWTERRDAFGTPQRHQACSAYLSGAELGLDYWEVEMPDMDPSSLLVITGCRSAQICGTPPKLESVSLTSIRALKEGKIAAAFVSLTQQVSGTGIAVSITGNNLTGSLVLEGSEVLLNHANPMRTLDWRVLTNETALGTTLSLSKNGAQTFSRSFADIATYVDTSVEAQRYYAHDAFVVVAVGELDPKDKSHPQRKLHLLALPLENPTTVIPEPRPDGGLSPLVDAGTPALDGGGKGD